MDLNYIITMCRFKSGEHKSAVVSFKNGFTLIEVMIAMVILLIGLLSFLGLQATAIRVNEANKRLIIAKDAATQEIEAVKTSGYVGLKTSANLTTNMGYSASLGGLTSDYQFTGIDTTCNSPYNYCVYKGINITKDINGQIVNYYHTVKLSVDVDYLSYPVLERCETIVHWQSKGELKKLNFIFFVEQKE